MERKVLIYEKSWDEFRKTGILWTINRILSLLGWTINFEMEGNRVKRVYPARFEKSVFSIREKKSMLKVTEYINDHFSDLEKRIESF